MSKSAIESLKLSLTQPSGVFISAACSVEVFAAEKSNHPNELNFKGVMVVLDQPSTRPPNGSDGHLINVSTEFAKKSLKGLIGMGLNYAPSLSEHMVRRKVGVIKKAWVDGNKLWVSGVIWKRDFPEAEEDLKKKGLGMSMELADVDVADKSASVWDISEGVFTGATILYKKAAAYEDTLAVAAAAAIRETFVTQNSNGGNKMAKEKLKLSAEAQATAELTAAAVAKVLATVLEPFANTMKATQNRIAACLEEMQADALEAKAKSAMKTDADDMESSEDVAAAKKKKADDDDDDDDADDEEDIDSAAGVQAELENLADDDGNDLENDNPGQLNKDADTQAKNPSKKVGDQVNEPVTGSAVVARYQKMVKDLIASTTSLQKRVKVLESAGSKKVVATATKEKTVEAAASEAAVKVVDRRSLGADARQLLAKNNLDADYMRENQTKMSLEEADGMIRAAGITDVTHRIALKNSFVSAGILDEGIVTR